jgi:hypothetical protein
MKNVQIKRSSHLKDISNVISHLKSRSLQREVQNFNEEIRQQKEMKTELLDSEKQ